MKNKTRKLVFGALVAALYAALTVLLAPISYGQIQVRVAEALTILPFFSSFSIPGLFVGCIVANFIGGNGIIDIVFGSTATLLAAALTYFIGKSTIMKKAYLAPLPPVIVNALIIGGELTYLFHIHLVISILSVGIGEFLACYVLGLPLLMAIEKNKALRKYLQ